MSLSILGIVGIAIHSAERQGGTLCNLRGLRLADGAFAPTYDWTPTSK